MNPDSTPTPDQLKNLLQLPSQRTKKIRVLIDTDYNSIFPVFAEQLREYEMRKK
ncbi:MAG TPA: hypothetical protein PKE06_08410 [Flavilitoribacter sp.]|nr:hypothetical protein [Flavilitoribacter sp.]HMQ86397.1 hypothetical protein [Flavilitoribacter sp.]